MLESEPLDPLRRGEIDAGQVVKEASVSRQRPALRHLCFLNIKFNDMIVPLFVSESWAHSKRYRDEEEYGRD